MKSMSASNRVLMWAGVALAALIAVAFALNAFGVTEYDPDSPEGVVQAYLNAVLDGDEDIARQYLSPALRERCEDGDDFFRFRDERDARVALTETRLTDDGAVVDVRVTEGSPDLFDSSAYTHEESYRLIETEDGWLIDQHSWPWYGC